MKMLTMDEAVRDYINRIAPEHRSLFDRLQRLILTAHPEAKVVLSYGIPTYKVDNRRLHVGAWQHGLSIYGWGQGRVDAFTCRHPTLRTSKGTIRLQPADSDDITDDELGELVNAALDDVTPPRD